jgi:hypothetical protein
MALRPRRIFSLLAVNLGDLWGNVTQSKYSKVLRT